MCGLHTHSVVIKACPQFSFAHRRPERDIVDGMEVVPPKHGLGATDGLKHAALEKERLQKRHRADHLRSGGRT